MKKYLIFVLVYMLTGCVSYISGYIPNKSNENNITLSKEQRKDITFSVSYDSEVGHDMADYVHKTMINEIKDTFGKSQLFRRVHYMPYSNKNKYHYHFDVKLTGPTPDEQIGSSYLIGLTLAIIPSKMNFYADITMFVFENGKEVYSITAPEKVNDIYWLPLIVGSPFMNHYVVVPKVLNNSNQYFIQKIIENKLYE